MASTTFDEEWKGTIPILRIDGPLTSQGTIVFLRRIAELMAQGRNRIVLDFEKCAVLDAGGFKALRWAQTEAHRHGGVCALLKLPEHLRGGFETAGLLKIYADYATEAQAVASVLAE